MSRLLLDLSAMNVSRLLLDLSAMTVRSVRISSFFLGKIHSTTFEMIVSEYRQIITNCLCISLMHRHNKVKYTSTNVTYSKEGFTNDNIIKLTNI